MLEIEDHIGGLLCWKRVPMHTDPERRRQFRPNAVVLERDGVVTGLRDLLGMLEGRGVSRLSIDPIVQARLPCHWHKQHVGVVRDARAAQVRMRKPIHSRVAVVVSGAPVPAGEPRVGPRLDHPERQRGAGIRMTVPTGANEWIDKCGQLLCGLRRGMCGQQAQQSETYGGSSHHVASYCRAMFFSHTACAGLGIIVGQCRTHRTKNSIAGARSE